MLEEKKHTNRDFSKYDSMSSELLNKILKWDFESQSEEDPDMDAILYITEVLAGREKENPTLEIPDADTAWKSFNENYRPMDTDGKSLYDDEEPAREPIQIDNYKPVPKSKGFLRVACIIAATVALVVALTITSYAMGYDLWGAVATWTHETFGFSVISEKEADTTTKEVPEQLKELENLMSEHGISNSQLPTYLPEGCENAVAYSDVRSESVVCFGMVNNDNGSIFLRYTLWLDSLPNGDYQKDEEAPEIYVVGDKKYYIMTNYDIYYAAWSVDNLECSISGVSSKEELILMIDSINGG